MTASELAQRLDAKRNGDGWKARCPAHDDRTPSLTISENERGIGLKCWAGCELDSITRALNIEVKELFYDNKMNEDQFKAVAKSTFNAKEAPAATLSPLSTRQVEALAKWRGYSLELVEWMNKYGLIGHFENNIAFPVENGVHFRKKDGTGWRYSTLAKPTLFVLGGIEEGAPIHAFESQWDALAYADASGDRTNIVATRGAGNVKLLIEKLKDHSGVLYLWPQNDDPGRKWAKDICEAMPLQQIKLATIPQEYKDLNEWRKDGNATGGNVFNAYLDATDFPRSQCDTTPVARARTPSQAPPIDGGVETNLEQSVATAAEPTPTLATPELVATGTVAASESPVATPVQPPTSEAATPLAQTLGDVATFLRRYVVFPLEEQADVIALWVAHAWTFGSFRFTPYLNVCSPEKRCGKTRLLECIELLVPKPRRSGGISAAALRRRIDREKPTLLLDEIDTIFGTEKNESNEALRGALNEGFHANGIYTCCDGTKNDERDFRVFCPKVIAGIGRDLPDTVRDRSIEIRLVRQTSDKKAEVFRQEEAEKAAAPIRAELDAWSRASGKSLAQARPSMPSQLGDRQQDMMEPLVAIADDARGEWPLRAREALVTVGAAHEDTSTGVQLLADCRIIFETTGMDKLTSTALIQHLVEVESDNSPWPTWWEGDMKNNRTHAPARKLAKLLAPFEIKPATVRVGGDDDTARGYYRNQFLDAWKRYLDPVKKEMNNMELAL